MIENIDQKSEHKNEILKTKGNMDTVTMLAFKKFKEGENYIEGVNNSHRVINHSMNDSMGEKMTQNR